MQTIYLIDDDPIIHTVIRRIFAEEFQVECAHTGLQGLREMEKSQPDIALLDLRMPDLDGLEVFRLMRDAEQLKHIPVIFLTAEEDSSIEEICLQEGAIDYVKKPFAPRVLYNRVKNSLELISYRKGATGRA